MLVSLKANELVDGEIDYVSLVKHGANRVPWKIIKMEDLPKEKTVDTLTSRISSMFGKAAPQVGAFFVKTSELESYLPRIEKAGYKVDDREEVKGVTILKQDDFDGEEDVSMIAIDCNMGMAFDRVVKEFSLYDLSDDFQERVGAVAFFPGLHHAMEALADSIFNALDGAENMENASARIDKNLSAFRKHVNALVKNMPASVIKMERETFTNEVGGSTLDSSDVNKSSTEDGDMGIKEALAGDLAGLNATEEQDKAKLAKAEADAAAKAKLAASADVSKDDEGGEVIYVDEKGVEISEEAFVKGGMKGKKMRKNKDGTKEPYEKAADSDADDKDTVSKEGLNSPGSTVVQSTSDTGEVSRDEGLPAGYREVIKPMMKFEDGKPVEKSARYAVNDDGDEIFMGFVEKAEEQEESASEAPAPEGMEALAGPLNLIGKALNTQSEVLTEIKDGLAKQAETINALKKSSDEAVAKAEKTTLVDHGYDLDESLGLMTNRSPVTKSESAPRSESVWKGLAPELEALESRMRDQ